MAFIYVLSCPKTFEVRYVGKAERPNARLKSHLRDARIGRSHATAKWVRELLSEALQPQLKVLFRVPDGVSWEDAEKTCIAQYLGAGCRLTNSTAGGEGLKLLFEGAREAVSASLCAAWAKPHVREPRLEKMRATFATPESKARRIASAMEPETRAMKSAACKAALGTPEMKARLSAIQKANRSKPEAKASAAAATRAAWADPVKRSARVEALRAAASALRADPERSAKKAEAVKSALTTPESKARLAAAMAEVNSRPEVNAKRTATMKARWADKANRDKWLQSFNSADARAAQSESQKAAWAKRKAA